MKIRVSKGGHDIPPEVIARRYERGLENLDKYCALCNDWFVYDNSNNLSELIMDGNFHYKTIYNDEIFKKIKQYENKA